MSDGRSSRTVLTVAVCLLLVGAGCAGVTGEGGGVAAPSDPPPGLTADEVTDASALVGAHTRALSNRTFTVRTTSRTHPVEGGWTRTTNRTWRLDAGDPVRGTVTSRSKTTGDPPDRVAGARTRLSAYREGSTTYRRVANGSSVTYDRIGLLNTSVRLNQPLQRRPIASLSDRTNASVEPVVVDGQPRYRVTATLATRGAISNASIRLLVSPEGVVRSLRVRRTVEYRSGKRVVTRTARIEDVGSTTIDRPEWYDEAVAATGGDA